MVFRCVPEILVTRLSRLACENRKKALNRSASAGVAG
jgi:hypothetical protein